MRGFGFGFAGGGRDRPLGPPAAAPLVAPGYLATLSIAPYAVYGAQTLAHGYARPLFPLRRAADGATIDVSAQAGGDYPDYAAIAAWIGTSHATVPIIYDQTGNGRDLTQATVANQPSFDPTQKAGAVVPILIDGYGRSTASGLPQAQIAKTPSVGGLAIDLIDNSVFMGVASQVSFNSSAFASWTSDDRATEYQGLFGAAEIVTLRSAATNESSQNTVQGAAPHASIDVIGATNMATQSTIYVNGASRTTGHTRTSAVMTRLTLGMSVPGGVPYNGMYRLYAMAVYASALSPADGAAVLASLDTALAAPKSYDYRVVFDGDSIMEGSGGALHNVPSWAALQFAKRAEIFNTAVHGQTLNTIYTGRVARFAPLFKPGLTNVFFVQAGTNDLTGGTTGAALYSSYAAPLVSYLKGLGFKVAICTLLPRGDAAYTTAMENERGAYNALVRANSVGADAVLDLTRNPAMGPITAPGDATLYIDKLHPTALGYRWLAGAANGPYAGAYTYYQAFQQMLATVP